MSKSQFVGVDGCPYGWFSVGLDTATGYEVKAFRTFRKLLDHYAEARLVLVDIPIGLPRMGQARGLASLRPEKQYSALAVRASSLRQLGR